MFAAAIIIVLVLCVSFIHAILDHFDRKRGVHVTLVRVGTDTSYETYEMVKIKNRVRLVVMYWSADWSHVKRGKIITSVKDHGSVRANLKALSDRTGEMMIVSDYTMSSYVNTTQAFFNRAGLSYGS